MVSIPRAMLRRAPRVVRTGRGSATWIPGVPVRSSLPPSFLVHFKSAPSRARLQDLAYAGRDFQVLARGDDEGADGGAVGGEFGVVGVLACRVEGDAEEAEAVGGPAAD